MITEAVLEQAAIIAAAMLVALACLDWIAEHVGHRGIRFLANFVLLGAFTLGLEYLLGSGAAVVETLTH